MLLVIIGAGVAAILIIVVGVMLSAKEDKGEQGSPFSIEDAQAMGIDTASQKTNNSGCTGFVIGGVFFLVGAGILGYGFHRQNEISDIDTWPTTQATVTGTHISEDYDSEDGTTYDANVDYTYWVNDIQYSGSFRKGNKSTRSSAQRVLDQYPHGSQFTVYYDPDHHSRSEHDPAGAKQEALVMMLFGGGFAAIGLVAAAATIFSKG